MTTFDLDAYLLSLDSDKLYSASGRRELTREDPLAFALVYLPEHLQGALADHPEKITLSDVHIAWCNYGKSWMKPVGRRDSRTCFVAPRNMGKSTWLFTILPMWAAAHGWSKFIVALSDTAEQAKTHLETFRNELYTNDLLRNDYPDLCEPKKRPVDPNNPNAHKLVGKQVTERQDRIQMKNDFVFAAGGMTAGVSGMKVGKLRPDLMILDDIEPTEDKYGDSEVRKRTTALIDKVLYLNEAARVAIVGTVTRVGSIIHQLIQHELNPKDDDPAWIDEQNIKTFYFAPIVSDANGVEQSIWPEKWPIDELQKIRHQRDYKKNFLNQPINVEGNYWCEEDVKIKPEFIGTRRILTIDPATTSGMRSDYTGIAVVSCNPFDKTCCVEWCKGVKMTPPELRKFLLDLLEEDEDISGIVIEVNQGGDTWKDVLYGLPVKLLCVTNSESKVLRLTRLLTHYQRSRVVHRAQLDQLEEQMFAYAGSYKNKDDLIDAVSVGVDYFARQYFTRRANKRMSVRTVRYA